MAKLRILGRNGDTVIEYTQVTDRKSILEGVVLEEIKEAERVFDEKVKGEGYLAFAVTGDKKKIVYSFDPSADSIVLSPPVVGG